MPTIKSYTDISQSKKLAEILPLNSADMCCDGYALDNNGSHPVRFHKPDGEYDTHCWSLAALLTILPNYQLQTQDNGIGVLCSCDGKFNIVTANNPVDACYEMIIKLHELNLL